MKIFGFWLSEILPSTRVPPVILMWKKVIWKYSLFWLNYNIILNSQIKRHKNMSQHTGIFKDFGEIHGTVSVR